MQPTTTAVGDPTSAWAGVAPPERPSGTTDPLPLRTCAVHGQFCPQGWSVDRSGVEWLVTRPQQTMPLFAGTRLGHDAVTALLGEGAWGSRTAIERRSP